MSVASHALDPGGALTVAARDLYDAALACRPHVIEARDWHRALGDADAEAAAGRALDMLDGALADAGELLAAVPA